VKRSERADPDLDGSRFRRGVEQFNRREYWKAHDSWEAVWQASSGDRRQMIQGLIQIAAACYHIEKGHAQRAIERLVTAALGRLDPLPDSFGGVDLATIRDEARRLPSATPDTFRPPRIRLLPS
jgi:uncharacterized protein